VIFEIDKTRRKYIFERKNTTTKHVINSIFLDEISPDSNRANLPVFYISHVRSFAIKSRLLSHYHHYDELTELLSAWSSNNTRMARLFTVGQSAEGKQLNVIRLTLPMPAENEEIHDEYQLLKPKFKWIANMHGDETIGREIMIALIYYLILNSNTDTRVNQLLTSTDIYIMPTMNPVKIE